ncbi:hypothetical protein LSAT2_024841, partial [Lamellibrachia satsuma]
RIQLSSLQEIDDMVNRSLIVTAVLLYGTIAAVTEAAVNVKPAPVIIRPPFRPFCYCPAGYVTRWVWPYCKCYKFVRDLASWAEAKVYCGVLRARMVEDRDFSTHYWLRWQLRNLRIINRHHLLEKQEYWLGATDIAREGLWKWDPSYTNVGPTFWISGQPENYLGYQNCMAIKRRPFTSVNSYYYDWFDDDCYQKKFYICEKRAWFCWGWPCLHKLDESKTEVSKYYIPGDVTREKMEKQQAATDSGA